MLNLEVKGYVQAKAIMDQLSNNMQKKMLVSALRISTRPVLRSARAQVPVRDGKLRKILRVARLRKTDRPSEVAVAVKHVFSRSKRGKENQYYGKFVHEGTKDPRAARKKGQILVFQDASGQNVFRRSVKGIKPNPYLERAYAESGGRIPELFGGALAESVNKFVNKNFKPVK